MSETTPKYPYARIVRRETHSPRSTLAIVLAVLVILAVAWLITEIVLSLLGHPPLLSAPAQLAAGITELPTFATDLMIAVGSVLALAGIILVVAAVTAGRRARHSLVGERSAVVVDNAVIASALARHAARAGAVDPDSTRVTVGHRRATVEITPTSGFAVDTAAVEAAVTTQLESFGLRPLLAPRVIVHTHGKVGA